MKILIKIFGLFIILAGISLLVKPQIILDWIVDNMQSNTLYLFAIIARFIFGILFLVTAKGSKYPVMIQILGYLFILAAIIFIFIGQETFRNFISSLIPYVNPYASFSGLLAIAFGSFLMYAFSKTN